MINTDKAYAFLEEDAYDMVINHTGDKEMMKIKDKYKKGGKVDMCQGLKEWMEDERNEGTGTTVEEYEKAKMNLAR